MGMTIETGAYALLTIMAVGVALVILQGVSYQNFANTKAQFVSANVPAGIQANFTTNAGNTANTAGTNSNYVFYILFAALAIGVVIGVLVGVVRKNS